MFCLLLCEESSQGHDVCVDLLVLDTVPVCRHVDGCEGELEWRRRLGGLLEYVRYCVKLDLGSKRRGAGSYI